MQLGNEALVHHMEVFHCETSPHEQMPLYRGPCFAAERPNSTRVCKRVLAAWAMGAKPFIYPKVSHTTTLLYVMITLGRPISQSDVRGPLLIILLCSAYTVFLSFPLSLSLSRKPVCLLEVPISILTSCLRFITTIQKTSPVSRVSSKRSSYPLIQINSLKVYVHPAGQRVSSVGSHRFLPPL